MNEKPEIEVGKLPVITKFIYTLGVLPTSYLMSMTYQEQVTWLYNYLQTQVIPLLNTESSAIQELQTLYELLRTYVNDYFDNLDVQEEINNKLDEMAQDGSLTYLIKNYVDPLINSQNQRITSIENELQSVASGSPLVASSISEMTDTTRVYVNTTDGKWYYYNGNSWEIGGVYQAIEIGKNSIKKPMYYKTINIGENLFDKQNYYYGYIDNNDTVHPNQASSGGLNIYTDYIPIDSNYTGYTIKTYNNIVFYDNSKTKIGYQAALEGRNANFPEGTKYIRCSFKLSNLDNIMICYNRAPSGELKYEPHKYYIDEVYSPYDVNYFDNKLIPDAIHGQYVLGKNQLNPYVYEEGVVSGSGGAITNNYESGTYNEGVTSPFYEVDESTTYFIGAGKKSYACYDTSKNYLSGQSGINVSTITTPANTKYIKISSEKANFKNICLCKQNYPSTEPYRLTIPYLINERFSETSSYDVFYKKEINSEEMFNSRSNISDNYITSEIGGFDDKVIILNENYDNADTTRLTYWFKVTDKVMEIDFDALSSIVSGSSYVNGNTCIGIKYYDYNNAALNFDEKNTYIQINNTKNFEHKKVRYLIPNNAKIVRLLFFSRVNYSLKIKNINVKFVERATNYSNGILKFVGHQGANLYAPQNTMPSFEYAVRAGFDSCVININYTSDNEIVCLHNDTIDATSNGTGNIHEMTYQDALQYDFGSWFGNGYENIKLPLLEDVLKLFATTGVKPIIRWNDTITQSSQPIVFNKIFDLLKKYNLTEVTRIIGFSIDRLILAHTAHPEFKYGYCGSDELNSSLINKLHQLGTDVLFDRSYEQLTASEVNTCRTEGFKVSVWFINTPTSLYNAISLGVDEIKTDIYSLQNCNF